MTLGVAYFGNRILRHVAADMDDLSRRGFTGVLHTFSENDLNYYRDQLARVVATSHDAGLEVQISPWGVGHTFGGEAESLFTAAHPEVSQEFDDGHRVGAGCPNHPAFRDFVKRWADAALETGADRVFWDEPHWAHPSRFGVSEDRWSCVCRTCREAFESRYDQPMPRELTPEVVAFRQESLTRFVRELVAYVADRGGRNTVCLLPPEVGSGHADWTAVATAPGLDTLAADPYWEFFGRDAATFVGDSSRRVTELAKTHGITSQIWIQGFGLGPEDVDDIHAAVTAARRTGVEELWVWGYEACEHMSYLETRAPAVVWEALTHALTGGDDTR